MKAPVKCIRVGSVQRLPSRDQVTSLVLSSDGRYVGCHVRYILTVYDVSAEVIYVLPQCDGFFCSGS